MKQSLSFYIILLVLKLKGLKKDFSKDSIDFKKIRKGDAHTPKGKFFKRNILRNFKVLDSTISEIGLDDSSDNLVIFIHGGAFISGPSQHHWDTIKTIARQTIHKVWMCNYPKAPENKISTISQNIDAVYDLALQDFHTSNITLIGDSVGGTLILALTQRLVMKNIKVPGKLILITPVFDASLSNPEIDEVDKIDPMLSKVGVLSAKKMCAGKVDLKNPIISPLYGSFDKFPPTFLYMAENDIFYPDQLLAVKKIRGAGVDLNLIEGKNMPHVWPFLPAMKEAKDSLDEIIKTIKS